MNRDFSTLTADPTWSFADCTTKQTRYLTHGYHTYPAKFIPQLAARLIRELSAEGELVADPFMGSGTTIVEALLQARRAVGVDINPVAHLIAKVKSTPLEPNLLARAYEQLAREPRVRAKPPRPARIDYWFPPTHQRELARLLARITALDNADCRDFFLVAFSQILKSCSIWLQRSVKPTRDLDKTPADPRAAFQKQCRAMLARNREFWDTLAPRARDPIAHYRDVRCADARNLPARDGEVSLIVTSPPYVTSYEYADLHQLTALWFEYAESLPEFRKRFIGSAAAERISAELNSPLAERICRELGDSKKAREVRNYFADMQECFQEMRRALRAGGKACVVIGNTELRGVEIRNAEVFAEQMQNLAFRPHRIIKREIPSKILPQTRDPRTGKFTSSQSANRVQAYPTESILVMEK